MAEQWAMANDGDVPAPPAAVDDKAAAASVSSDEALARELQRQFDAEALANGATPLRAAATPPAGPASAALPPVPPEVDVDVDADYALALYLQGELDRQEAAAAEQLARRRNGNANAKVTVAHNRAWAATDLGDAVHGVSLSDDEPDIDDDDDDDVPAEPGGPHQDHVPMRRVVGPDGKVEFQTKHDLVLTARRNARRLEKLPLDFQSGNTEDDPSLRLSNRVYNQLRAHSMRTSAHSNEKDHSRLHGKEEFATSERAMDQRTRLMLLRLVNSGQLAELSGIISTGKEASVYTGVLRCSEARFSGRVEAADAAAEDDEDEVEDDEGTDDAASAVPSSVATSDVGDGDEGELVECAIKVFKTTLNEFRNRELYIRDDWRFDKRVTHASTGRLIDLWAEKELSNLWRLQRAHIPSPTPLLLRKHVLIMSIVGTRDEPAPQLQAVRHRLSRSRLTDAYWQAVRAMRRMYWDAQLVHGDLSAYNMLYADRTVWIVDVSQAVLNTHPEAATFLLRDCRNVAGFFADAGVPDVMSPLELFVFVTADPGAVALQVHTEDATADDVASDVGGGGGGEPSEEGGFPQRDLLDYSRLDEFVAKVREDVAAAATAAECDPDANADELMRLAFHPRRAWHAKT